MLVIFLIKGWFRKSRRHPNGILRYEGSDYQCKTAHRQCYWETQEEAIRNCQQWEECHYIFETPRYSPDQKQIQFYARTTGTISTNDYACDAAWIKNTGMTFACVKNTENET